MTTPLNSDLAKEIMQEIGFNDQDKFWEIYQQREAASKASTSSIQVDARDVPHTPNQTAPVITREYVESLPGPSSQYITTLSTDKTFTSMAAPPLTGTGNKFSKQTTKPIERLKNLHIPANADRFSE